ncbi:uncharacterized protein LOC143025465 [Oratosquilla oratoria]|uniref:uncharacterized protein LOC143025465 n=1 Tax=Oratosquilla oratoria TaxID=337810 RepID=UPI003F774C7D
MMESQEYLEIFNYLSKNKYPESIKSKDSRSNFRKKCRPFQNIKEELLYYHKKYGHLKVVKGQEEKLKVIKECHQQLDGRHYGINRTLKKISTRYYWKTIAKDVHCYIKRDCQSCIKQALQHAHIHKHAFAVNGRPTGKIMDKAIQQIGLEDIGNILEPCTQLHEQPNKSLTIIENGNSKQTRLQVSTQPTQPNSQMSPTAVTSKQNHVMLHCGLDLVGPLSETHKGHKYVVILTDSATKWVEVMSTNEATTEHVGNFLCDIMCRHGLMEEIIIDQGPEFCNRLNDKVCSIMGTSLRVSSLYPLQNGYIDKYWYNDLLCNIVAKFATENQYQWDVYLNRLVFAYRTFFQKSLNGSPIQLLYNKQPQLPPYLKLPTTNNSSNDEQDALYIYATNFLKSLSVTGFPVASMITHKNEQDCQTTTSSITTPTSTATMITSGQANTQPSSLLIPSHAATTHIQSNTLIIAAQQSSTLQTGGTTLLTQPTNPSSSSNSVLQPTPPLSTSIPQLNAHLVNSSGSHLIPVPTTLQHSTSPSEGAPLQLVPITIQADGKQYTTDSFYVACP